jgi:hypothetical protein
MLHCRHICDIGRLVSAIMYKLTMITNAGSPDHGFRVPGLTSDIAVFPNQLQSLVICGDQA